MSLQPGRVRPGGWVVDYSIERHDRGLMLRFAVRDRDGDDSRPVVYRGVVPDLFGCARDGYYRDAVIERRLRAAGVLEAQQLLVSHGAWRGVKKRRWSGGSARGRAAYRARTPMFLPRWQNVGERVAGAAGRRST